MSTTVNELYQELEELIKQGYGDCAILQEHDHGGYVDGVGEFEAGLMVKIEEYDSLEFYPFSDIELAKSSSEEERYDYQKRLLKDIEDNSAQTVVAF